MIPLPVLPPLPWRLIGAVALVVVVALMGWRVSVWHGSHQALQATEKALGEARSVAGQCAAREARAAQAWREAAAEAESKAARDRATAERVERELEARLSAADARGRDLARRLSDAARAGACRGTLPAAPGAPGEPAGAAGEPAGAGAIGEATAALIGACDRDSARLAGWQQWWAGVSR